MKISITGANGRLGSYLVRMGCEPLSCDVQSKDEVEVALKRVKPDLILHLAAQTSVDWCEKNEVEAMAVNVYGTAVVCDVASNLIGEGRVVLISTDQVFNGLEGNYLEDSQPDPINVYGKTKESAEGVADLYDCKTIRISRCFNTKSQDISDYLYDIANGVKVYVPEHLYRTHCHANLMAKMLWEYANRFDDMPEILHLSGADFISFHDLIVKIAESQNLNSDLIYRRGDKEGYTSRPHRTGLNTDLARKLGFCPPTISESIVRFSNERL